MKLSDCSEAERQALAVLQTRIGRVHVRQRLGLEADHEQVFRRGTHFFHLENWYFGHGLLRVALTLLGLHGRGRRNVMRIQLKRNEVALDKLPAAFDGYTLLHLSDLHLDLSEAYVVRLIECVQGLEYDACVLTGDFRFRTHGGYDAAMVALARLRPHLNKPTYAVLGNHDTIRMVPRMEALDIRVLMNESVRIDRYGDTLYLAGIDDAHYFRTHSFYKAADDIPEGACAVLLSHTPEPYRHAAHSDFSLMLCGHTHGGQICLPGGLPILTDSEAPRRFARGPWRYGDLIGYTSVGCGSSIVDVRLNCLPEITLHRLRRADSPRASVA